MNEFEQKDYEQARTTADAIKDNGENILDIFNNIDRIMNTLYGETWESCGATNAHARYDEIRKNYEVFYNQILNMHKHIHNVTASNESTDTRISSDVASV